MGECRIERCQAVAWIAMLASACMGDAESDITDIGGREPAITHEALLSIQEASVARRPEAGHGLSVRLDFNAAARRPDVEEFPGEVTGCRAWRYDTSSDRPPAPSGDEGQVIIDGTHEPLPGPCVYVGGSGYICPAGRWELRDARVTPQPQGRALYDIPGATIDPELALGRYLWVDGVALGNAGRFPILSVPTSDSLLAFNATAVEETMAFGSALVLAGAGPVPNNPRNPIRGGETVSLRVEPSAGGHFTLPLLTIVAGQEFQPDAATLDLMTNYTIDRGELTWSCAGEGGRCGSADVSALSITTSDGDLTGVPEFGLPPARRYQVVVLCAEVAGDGSIAVPASVSSLIAAVHAESPITRIRVAYMRDGLASARNAPGPPNPVNVLVGHQVLGFTTLR